MVVNLGYGCSKLHSGIAIHETDAGGGQNTP